MEAGLLVKYRIVLGALAALSVTVLPTIQAKERQDLRLYRINKDGISDRFWFTRGKARKPGCHNILKKSRLHRAVQFGYPACHIYTSKNCTADSVLTFKRDGEEEETSVLLEGYSWFTISDNERGVRIKSWHCGESLIAEDVTPEVELSAD
ncbi:hypothetical protein NBRC116583_17430 [Arenicella sp. 4NH20-0111]